MQQENEIKGGEIAADQHGEPQTEGTQTKVDEGESQNIEA